MPYVQITLGKGRPTETKQALVKAVAEAVNTSIGAPIDSIRVWINEVEPAELYVGGELLSDKRAREAAAAAR